MLNVTKRADQADLLGQPHADHRDEDHAHHAEPVEVRHRRREDEPDPVRVQQALRLHRDGLDLVRAELRLLERDLGPRGLEHGRQDDDERDERQEDDDRVRDLVAGALHRVEDPLQTGPGGNCVDGAHSLPPGEGPCDQGRQERR
jgi:hypothetical protein